MKKFLNTLLKAMLAGFTIGLGGTTYLRIKDAFPGAFVVGAVLFTVGLFVIVTRDYALFTGKAARIPDEKPSYLLYLLTVWVGNFLGCMAMAGLEHLTTLCGVSGIDAAAAAIVEAKLSAPNLSLFVLGFFCNIFIFLAVSGYTNITHELGKYLSLFLGVICFILCGTEHCIADMYYFCISGVIFSSPLASLRVLAVITLGNIAGAVFLPLMERLVKRVSPV